MNVGIIHTLIFRSYFLFLLDFELFRSCKSSDEINQSRVEWFLY